MTNKLKRWIGFNFDDNQTFEKPPREGTGESDEMKQFFKDLKSDLKKTLGKQGIQIQRMKPNYYDVSVVVTDGNGQFAYISFGNMRWTNQWDQGILVRTMKHEKDWTGGLNHWCSYEQIPDQILQLWNREGR